MKIQHTLKLAIITALLSVGSVHAQTSDSTALPSNTAAPRTTFTPSPRINTYIASGGGAGRPNAAAYASCGANKMIAGGGSCWDGYGMTPVIGSQPNGNGWSHACSSYNGNTAYATSYAVCSY